VEAVAKEPAVVSELPVEPPAEPGGDALDGARQVPSRVGLADEVDVIGAHRVVQEPEALLVLLGAEDLRDEGMGARPS
jgi:hypothetical protein